MRNEKPKYQTIDGKLIGYRMCHSHCSVIGDPIAWYSSLLCQCFEACIVSIEIINRQPEKLSSTTKTEIDCAATSRG